MPRISVVKAGTSKYQGQGLEFCCLPSSPNSNWRENWVLTDALWRTSLPSLFPLSANQRAVSNAKLIFFTTQTLERAKMFL